MTLQVDTSVAAVINSTPPSVCTTAAFNCAANTLLVVAVTVDGPANSAVTCAITDNTGLGLSWTLAKRQNGVTGTLGGGVEIWTAVCAAGFTSKTITATNSRTTASDATDLRVLQFTDTNGGIPSVGAVAGADITVAATNFRLSLTTTAANSWIVTKCLDYTSATTFVTTSTTTVILGQGNDGDGDQYATGLDGSLTVCPTNASGTNLTAGLTAGANHVGHSVAVEIKPGVASTSLPTLVMAPRIAP